MKKMLKLAAVLVALFAMTNFIACSDGGSSSSSGGTDDTSNGSTVKLDGHVGKYYTLYYGYFSDKTLKSCIYFETSKTGTLWWTPTDGSTNFSKKSFTYTAAMDEYGTKRLDITWEGMKSTEATFLGDDDYFTIMMFFDDGDVSDYNVDTKPDVLN